VVAGAPAGATRSAASPEGMGSFCVIGADADGPPITPVWCKARKQPGDGSQQGR
jgi:hypothetical protein